MRIQTAALLFVLSSSAEAFSTMPQPMARSISVAPSAEASSSALFAKKRQQKKRQVKKQSRLVEAMDDVAGKAKEPEGATATADPAEKQRQEAMSEAQQRYEQRPEVSTMVMNEDGTEILAQGQKVMDVVTRRAVKLSNLGADARLAQMFPGVPPDVREQYRLDASAEAPEIIEKLLDACMVDLGDGTRGIPKHPSLSNKGIDFVLANRDKLGFRMKRLIGRYTFNRASSGNVEEAKEVWNKLHKNFLTMENYISGPFRQIMQDAEGRVGPNFGNLEILSYCNGDLYERIGNYLVLKGMVAHWEKKVVDADFFENQEEDEELNKLRGDPKRFLRDSPILFTLKECTQVCAMAQQMCKLFVEEEALYGDMPPEIVFLEDALKIKGGTALRKYMIDEFCPARGITPEGLREGIRRLYQQLENMQVDPYADLTFKLEQLYNAMAVGTDDARDPYLKYLSYEASEDSSNPAYFETYTFNYPSQSMIRFLDNTYPSKGGINGLIGPPPAKSEEEGESSNPFDGLTKELGNSFNNLLGQMNGERNLRVEPDFVEDNSPYTPPKERALGREHDLGWFEELNRVDEADMLKLGEMEPGRIIME